jgi:multiple sugar transport system substrate-binding protein
VAALAVACGASPGIAPAGGAPDGAGGAITWLVRSQQVENDWQQSIVLPRMKERYPRIEISREIAPPDAVWSEKVFAMHAAGTPPDVHNGIVGTFIQLYAQDKLVELGPLAARDRFDLKAFGGLEKDQDMCRSGKQWALPILTTLGQVTFYNRTAFEQAGVAPPPASWQDRSWTVDAFLDAARRTTKNAGQPDAVYGAQVFGGNALHGWPYLWGADPYPKDFYTQGIAQQSGWTAPGVVEAVQFYADLSLRHGVVVRRGAPSRPFREGGAAMWLTTGWSVSPDLRDVSLFQWGMAPVPWKTTNKTLSFTDCVLITNATRAKDAAWALVAYLTGKEGQLEYSTATGRPPTRPDSFDPWLDQTLTLPGIRMTKEALRQVVTGYLGNYADNWAHFAINAAAYQEIQRDVEAKFLTGALGVGAAMTEMKSRIDAAMQDAYGQFRSSPLVRDTPCT